MRMSSELRDTRYCGSYYDLSTECNQQEFDVYGKLERICRKDVGSKATE